MKKLSIVLLALLLVGGMAFAEITLTGSADLSLGFDLDTEAYGLTDSQDTSDVEFSFTLDTASLANDAEADVYAVIEMSGSIDVNIDGTDLDDDDSVFGDDETGDEIVSDVSIETAKIVGPDWEVSILGMPNAMNYATSFQDADGDDDVDADDNNVSGGFGDEGGVAVTYGDYSIGADFYNAGTATYALYAATSMEVAEGVTVGLGAAIDETDFDMSAKACYESDELTAKVAADFADMSTAFEFDASFMASATVADAMVTANAYYGSIAAGTADDFAASLEVAYAPVTLTVTGSDIDFAGAWDLSVEASVAATDEIAVSADFAIGSDDDWNTGAEVVYTVADYTATLGGGINSDDVVDLNAKIESSSIVEGATLSLAYAADDVTEADLAGTYDDGHKGSVKAMVSIAL